MKLALFPLLSLMSLLTSCSNFSTLDLSNGGNPAKISGSNASFVAFMAKNSGTAAISTVNGKPVSGAPTRKILVGPGVVKVRVTSIESGPVDFLHGVMDMQSKIADFTFNAERSRDYRFTSNTKTVTLLDLTAGASRVIDVQVLRIPR